MGLAIEVGALADLIVHDPEGADWIRGDLGKVNAALRSRGLPPHDEPEDFPSLTTHGAGSFPYSFLHYLRRAFALVEAGREVRPVIGDTLSESDEQLIDRATLAMRSHLLCHSDVEGYYVPIDFADPIIDEALPGAMLGSSQRLLGELAFVAPSIDIELADGQLTSGQLERLNSESESGHRFELERIVWLSLFEAAAISVGYRTAILFA